MCLDNASLIEGAIEAHPVDQGHQSLRLGAIAGFASLAPVAHRAGKLQNAQVLGNCRLRHAGTISQGMHGLLPAAG